MNAVDTLELDTLGIDTSLSVIVLAGGHSRRMGQDKALLTHQGQSLLSRTIEIAQQLSNEVLLVTPWPERYQTHLPDTIRYITEERPAPQKPSAGPLSGFVQGWNQTHSDWCLLLACDLPYLEAHALQQWWQWILAGVHNQWANTAWTNTVKQPIASLAFTKIPANQKTCWQPLCGYYHRNCKAGLNQQVAQQQRSFQTWLTSIPIARYEGISPHMLFNCNTPADWAQVITGAPLNSSHREEPNSL